MDVGSAPGDTLVSLDFPSYIFHHIKSHKDLQNVGKMVIFMDTKKLMV